MFQLYKQRNFNDIFNDTFSFIKQEGKSYFKNYFIICGGLLLLIALFSFFLLRVYFQSIFSGLANPGSQQMLNSYFMNNAGYYFGLFTVMSIIFCIVAMINTSFPIVFLKLTADRQEKETRTLFNGLKKRIGKIIIFFLLSLISFVPIIFIVFFLNVLLCFIIIGFLLLPIVFAALTCWIILSLYDYLSTDNTYWQSMGVGFTMLFKNFWTHMGATLLFYIMIYILQTIVTLIPYFIGLMVTFLGTHNTVPDADRLSTLGIIMLVTGIFGTLLSFILGNINLINIGMIYYSCKEQDENHSVNANIDLIGSDFE